MSLLTMTRRQGDDNYCRPDAVQEDNDLDAVHRYWTRWTFEGECFGPEEDDSGVGHQVE